MLTNSINPFSYSNYINPYFRIDKSFNTIRKSEELKAPLKENKKNCRIKVAISATIILGTVILGMVILKKNNKNLKKSFNTLFKDSNMKDVSFAKRLKTFFAGDEAIDRLTRTKNHSSSNFYEYFNDRYNDGMNGIYRNREPEIRKKQQSCVNLHDVESKVESHSISGEQLTKNKVDPLIVSESNIVPSSMSESLNNDEYFSHFIKKLAHERYELNPDIQKIQDILTRDFDNALKSQDIANLLTYYEKLVSRKERFILNPEKKDLSDFLVDIMSAFERYLKDKHGIFVKKACRGDIFDPSIMKKIDTIKTVDQALDGIIESMYHPGFINSKGKEIRPLRVNVYKFGQE